MAEKRKRATILLAQGENSQAVMKRLRAAGFSPDGPALGDIGVVSGSVAADKFEALKKISGVESIEAEGGFQIAPPESEVQ